MKTRRFFLAAGIALAMAFMLSCFPDGGEGGSNISTCGGKEYDTTVYFCERGELAGSCRGQTYYPEYQNCENGEIREGAAISSSSLGGVSSSSVGGKSSSSGGGQSGGNAVVIGGQTWMAKNLDIAVEGSKCFGEGSVVIDWDEEGYIEKTLTSAEVQANCATYGRLYNWATAMNLPPSCNSSDCAGQINNPHQGICPSGWHIPSNGDWDKLFRFVDGDTGTESPYDSPTAGRYLKATSGWYNCGPSGSGSSFLCEDAHGFSALPGGYGLSDGSFYNVGYHGNWWSATEFTASDAYYRAMYCNYSKVDRSHGGKSNLFSVRCAQD